MSRWIIWTLCVLAGAVLYVFTGSASALLLLCSSILLPGAALLLAALGADGASVELGLPVSVQKGQKIQGTLLVENLSAIPIVRLKLTLKVLNMLTGQEKMIPMDCSAGPREQKELAFAFESAHCGQFVFSCTELRIFDFLGLRGISKHAQLREKRLVLPETFPLHVRLWGSENSTGSDEVFSVAHKGQDTSEAFQLRDYVEGDNRKQIHWKLSQKLDRYIVADPSQELERALLIIWDRGVLPEGAPPQVPDALAEALISVSIMLTTDEIPYSMAWKNGETQEMTIKDITTMDDLYDTIPGILGASAEEMGTSLIPDCLRALDGKRYPMIAYFTGKATRELEDLSQIGRTTVFLCNEEGFDADAGEHACWPFSPENYRSALRDITI